VSTAHRPPVDSLEILFFCVRFQAFKAVTMRNDHECSKNRQAILNVRINEQLKHSAKEYCVTISISSQPASVASYFLGS
jgi:hypothetical protein